MENTARDIGTEKEHSERVFDKLQLKGARIESRVFYACSFRNCDFTGASFRFCKFRDCSFESCNLSLVKVGASVFDGSSFRNSKLAGVNWTEAEWPKITLSGPPGFFSCVLTDCSFLGLPLAGASIKDCLAKEADFREAVLSKADLAGTDFTGALFGGTDLGGANLAGARNYAINAKENKVKGARFSLPEAMSLLYCLDIKII
ncbi:MAG: pentapeptide repeat-containing protein [Elusimicrobiales bacterium]|nr:pentapeptide repeat-containing protein [Elusimicrobiales bacterium]